MPMTMSDWPNEIAGRDQPDPHMDQPVANAYMRGVARRMENLYIPGGAWPSFVGALELRCVWTTRDSTVCAVDSAGREVLPLAPLQDWQACVFGQLVYARFVKFFGAVSLNGAMVASIDLFVRGLQEAEAARVAALDPMAPAGAGSTAALEEAYLGLLLCKRLGAPVEDVSEARERWMQARTLALKTSTLKAIDQAELTAVAKLDSDMQKIRARARKPGARGASDERQEEAR